MEGEMLYGFIGFIYACVCLSVSIPVSSSSPPISGTGFTHAHLGYTSFTKSPSIRPHSPALPYIPCSSNNQPSSILLHSTRKASKLVSGSLLQVGVGGGDEGDVPELLSPSTVTLDEVGEETEIDELEAEDGPTETHCTLENTGTVGSDGVGGTTVVDGITEDGGGNDGG